MATYLRHIRLRILVTLHEFTARISPNAYAAARLGVSAKSERRSASSGQLWPCQVISHLDRAHAVTFCFSGAPNGSVCPLVVALRHSR